jgi:3-deoxy-D-manno-octulosonic-acid transferase
LHYIFYAIYFFVVVVAWLLALPLLFLLSKFKLKYKESIPARFWLKNNIPLEPNGVWIHVCSFGEARAISSIVSQIPKELIRLSASTQTGYREIKKYTNQSKYLPFEPLLTFWINRQKMLIVMEAELWYLLFFVARKKGAKTILINARMSDKSFPKYKRFFWLYKNIFDNIDHIYAQTISDKERLEVLGAKNIIVNGNIKFASIAKKTKELPKPEGLLVCAASTHDKEEALILSAFRTLKSKQPTAKIVVVPRHPERFEVVDRMMKSMAQINGYKYHKWSDKENFDSDMILFDTLGELVNIYSISDIVVLGGAFEPHGGHNAAEAAQFSCKIISGEHYFNQKEIFAGIENLYIVKKDELSEVLQYPTLLKNSRLIGNSDISQILEQIDNVL